MQKLIQTKLFRLLLKAFLKEDITSQLEESYDEFAFKVLTRLQLETNSAELYYSLGFVYSKLAGICEQLLGEKGKKCPKNSKQSHVFGRIGHAGIGMANYCTKQHNHVCF